MAFGSKNPDDIVCLSHLPGYGVFTYLPENRDKGSEQSEQGFPSKSTV
jgi:hypothetical protein